MVLHILLLYSIRRLRFRFRRTIHVWIVTGRQLATHRTIFGLIDLTILRL